MKIEGMHGLASPPPLSPDANACVKCASTFLGRYRQVDIFGLTHRISTKNRVSVPTAASYADVRKPNAMAKAKELSQHFELAVTIRAADVVVHFLEEHDVGLVVQNDIANPARVIPTVPSADAFVDVVREDAQLHSAHPA